MPAVNMKFAVGYFLLQPRASSNQRSKVGNLVGPIKKEEILLVVPDMEYCVQNGIGPRLVFILYSSSLSLIQIVPKVGSFRQNLDHILTAAPKTF